MILLNVFWTTLSCRIWVDAVGDPSPRIIPRHGKRHLSLQGYLPQDIFSIRMPATKTQFLWMVSSKSSILFSHICAVSYQAIPATLLSACLPYLFVLYYLHLGNRSFPTILGLENRNFASKALPRHAAFCPPLDGVSSSFPLVHVHPNKCETNNHNFLRLSLR